MNKITYVVSGMTCSHCEETIKTGLLKVRGITDVDASFKTGLITITYKELPDVNKIKKTLLSLGYEYVGVDDSKLNNRAKVKEVLPIALSFIMIYLIIGALFGYDFFTSLPTVENTTPLLMLFGIGLLTSFHCIGMCGSINLMASIDQDGKTSFKRPFLYNLGRITSYTLIGGLIGLLGSFLAINNSMQGLIILFTASIMLLMSLSMLGWLPKFLYFMLPNFKKHINIKSSKAPFVIGLLNGLMPCGPLQAMQLYALSTGSFFLGALALFLFALGTVPLVFSFGFIVSKLKNKYSTIIQRASSVLIFLLALFMLNRGLVYMGINISNMFNETFNAVDYSKYEIAVIKDGYQYVEIPLTFSDYKPIIVEKGIPVIFNIKTENVFKYGCTNQIVIPSLNMEIKLKEGDNLIEFTPDKVGIINYSCWMGMATSHIRVVDDLNNIGK